MNYTGIIEMIREGLAEEREIADELAYKRGVKDTLDALDDVLEEEEIEDDEFDPYTAELLAGYLDGLDDAWAAAGLLYEMSAAMRYEKFGEISVEKIIEEWTPTDVLKVIFDEALDDIIEEELEKQTKEQLKKEAEEKKEKNIKKDYKNIIFSSGVSDEAKELFCDLFDSLFGGDDE